VAFCELKYKLSVVLKYRRANIIINGCIALCWVLAAFSIP
jgi:hypothetical protein